MSNEQLVRQMALNIQQRLIGKVAGGYGPDFQTPLSDGRDFGNISTPDALDLVHFAKSKGIDPEDVDVWYQRKSEKQGKTWQLKSMQLVKSIKSHVVTAWAKAQGEKFQVFSYEMNKAQRQQHGLNDKDFGYVAYLVKQEQMDLRSKIMMRLMDDPKFDKATFTDIEMRATKTVGVEGIGIVKQGNDGEKVTPPKGKSVAFVAEKRARKAALVAHFGEMTYYNKPNPVVLSQERLAVPAHIAQLGSETIQRYLSLPTPQTATGEFATSAVYEDHEDFDLDDETSNGNSYPPGYEPANQETRKDQLATMDKSQQTTMANVANGFSIRDWACELSVKNDAYLTDTDEPDIRMMLINARKYLGIELITADNVASVVEALASPGSHQGTLIDMAPEPVMPVDALING